MGLPGIRSAAPAGTFLVVGGFIPGEHCTGLRGAGLCVPPPPAERLDGAERADEGFGEAAGGAAARAGVEPPDLEPDEPPPVGSTRFWP